VLELGYVLRQTELIDPALQSGQLDYFVIADFALHHDRVP
jgi:hypothetical protein